MLSVPAVFLLLAAVPSLAIPPPDFGFPEAPNDTALSVTFQDNGQSVHVSEGELFGVNVVAQEPVVAVSSRFESISSYNGSYALLMVDPDASYPQDPTSRFILHWLQTDMTTAPQAADGTSQLVNSTAAQAPYRRPSPPTNSSAHRYILYAFQQHSNFSFPPAFEGYNAQNRTRFNLTLFLDESNLGQSPAAAMYFYASNQTQVPQDFTAAAGATYPGGNGDMITDGPGPSITPSITPASATASASVTSSGSAGPGSGTGAPVPTAVATYSATSGGKKAMVGTGILSTAIIMAFVNLV